MRAVVSTVPVDPRSMALGYQDFKEALYVSTSIQSNHVLRY